MSDMSKFKIVLDQEKCIGCNTCPLIDPDTFEMDTTIYKAKVKAQPQEISEKTKTAVSSCPVGAISIIEENN
jgi:ferredoxin